MKCMLSCPSKAKDMTLFSLTRIAPSWFRLVFLCLGVKTHFIPSSIHVKMDSLVPHLLKPVYVNILNLYATQNIQKQDDIRSRFDLCILNLFKYEMQNFSTKKQTGHGQDVVECIIIANFIISLRYRCVGYLSVVICYK